MGPSLAYFIACMQQNPQIHLLNHWTDFNTVKMLKESHEIEKILVRKGGGGAQWLAS